METEVSPYEMGLGLDRGARLPAYYLGRSRASSARRSEGSRGGWWASRSTGKG